MWILYLVPSFFVVVATISRVRLPCIKKLVDCVLSSNQLAWRQTILNLRTVFPYHFFRENCGTLPWTPQVVLMFIFELPPFAMMVYQVYFSGGVVRQLSDSSSGRAYHLSLIRLMSKKYFGTNAKQSSEKNLMPSLKIFYGVVLGQGILYIVAYLLEVFSFIPRRSLIHHSGFRGQLGVEYVNLYYAYAFEKCMGGAVLVPNKINLVNFAMDSLNSDSSRNKLYGGSDAAQLS
uniref:Uncharacterized protein n=1 Tax=Oryza brachyantha TaxID=4533 RepID=J3MNL3_ORYBR